MNHFKNTKQCRKLKGRRQLPILMSLILFALYFSGCKPKEEVKPNIVFIYTDDQAAWGIGVHGNSQFVTPNLDRLASEGAYFKNSFVTTPVCSPARVSQMTGQYASEYGIYDFIPHPKHKLYDPKNDPALSTESINFAEVLKNEGYKTGLIGKWHLGDWLNDETKKYHPTKNGFDYFMGLTGGGTTSINPTLEVNGTEKIVKGFTTNILTDYALNYITENCKNPFLLCVNFRAPHGPRIPVPEDDWAPYENLDPEIPNPDYPDLDIEKVKTKMKEYMASITGIDNNVGRILELINDLNLEKNTIVIFSSDHGYNIGHNGIEHKGNGYWITKTIPPAHGNIAERSRPNMYDNSLKVPAIIKWPRKIKAGIVIENVMTNLDWFPTIVEMGNAKVPENKIVRGRSLVPLLMENKVEDWNNDVYAEYSMINYSKAFMRTYRTPEWKLTEDFLNEGRDELYNLAEDPHETTNLIESNTKEVKTITQNLHEKILKKMQEINDPLLKKINSDKLKLKEHR